MSEPKFTRGPWVQHGSLIYANRPKDGGTICQVSEVRHSHIVEHRPPDLGSPDFAEIHANARLIAAAPDLYAAAARALHEMCHTTAPRNSFTDAVDALDAALSKARGEQ